ncbi:MAG: hypothetical protein F4233_09010, partial [Rhodospirillaceae bacterium]|nr:hypothetical protein [Rhodospirillaceae bacterium]
RQSGSPAVRQSGSPAVRQEANWQNRTLFHGDNLGFLRAMNSATVDLIATDPPFNKSKDFHATPDSLAAGAGFQDRWKWEEEAQPVWLDQIKDDYPAAWEVIDAANAVYMRPTKKNLKRPREEVGSDMGAFLCFMAVRLMEMKRILRPSGAIYLHCDSTACHYLKALMDSIFGQGSFRNQVIWRRTGSHNSADRFGPIHDVLLFYAMPEYRHTVLFGPYLRGHVQGYFKSRDDRGRYWTNNIHGSGTRQGASGQPWRGFNPTAHGRHWAVPSELVLALGIDPDLPQHDKLDALYEQGVIDTETNYLPTYRQYLADSPGQPLQDLWVHQPHTKGVLEGTTDEIDREVRWIPKRDKKERVGYPTQKPIGLYSRIIRSSTAEGDIVCDPFAGCATTCVAAEGLGRQWVGMDIWDDAKAVVLKRMERERMALPEAGCGDLFTKEIHFTDELPSRTDDGEPAAPFLRPKVTVFEPRGPKMTREAMYRHLLGQHGPTCQGCDRRFDDPRYLELDHNTPRSDGGLNHISNRILLCGPCNRAKSNTYTLSGLRRLNKRNGWMAGAEGEHPIMREIRQEREAAPPTLPGLVD